MPRDCFPWRSGATIRTLYWVSPDKRGIIPLDGFPCARAGWRAPSAAAVFASPATRAFGEVMRACAAPAQGREQTWINDEILRLYAALHAGGHAHSVECWQGGELVGRALWRSPGRGFFRRKHVQPRPRRLQGGAGASGGRACARAASCCWTPSFSPRIWPPSAPTKFPASDYLSAAASGDRARRRLAGFLAAGRSRASTGPAD